MIAGLAVLLGGYTLAYFGYCSLRGPGVGLLDLVIPGRTVVIPNSDGPAAFPRIAPTPGNPTPLQNPTAPYVPGQPAPAPWPGGGKGSWVYEGNKWVWVPDI